MESKIVALIPMRAGSKRLPGKHLLPIGAISPAMRAVNAALGVPEIQRVYVSTNDPEIAAHVRTKPVEVLEQPTASHTSTTEQAIGEFLKFVSCKLVVLIQATNLFVNSHHIKEGLALLRKTDADSVVSGVILNRYLYDRNGRYGISPHDCGTCQRVGLANIDGYFIENGAFYIFKPHEFKATGKILSGSVVGYVMPFETIHELDTEDDLKILRRLLA